MPLNAENKMVIPCVFDAFNNAVLCPGGRTHVFAHCFYGLMVMRVHAKCPVRIRKGMQTRKQTSLFDLDTVRITITRHALLVLDAILDLRFDILDQGSTTRYVKRLHAVTDPKNR